MPDASESGFRKNSIALSISREMAIDYGLVEATPEEIAERNESSKRNHAEQRARRAAFAAPIKTLAGARGLVGALAALHAPHEGAYATTCTGCTEDNEHGPQDWPCNTYRLVAEWARVPLPEGDMPGKHYEDDDWTPWDGKPFELPRPESFVTLDPDDIGGMD